MVAVKVAETVVVKEVKRVAETVAVKVAESVEETVAERVAEKYNLASGMLVVLVVVYLAA